MLQPCAHMRNTPSKHLPSNLSRTTTTSALSLCVHDSPALPAPHTCTLFSVPLAAPPEHAQNVGDVRKRGGRCEYKRSHIHCQTPTGMLMDT